MNTPEIFRRQLREIVAGDFDATDLLVELELLRKQATRRMGEARRTRSNYWRGDARLVDREIAAAKKRMVQ